MNWISKLFNSTPESPSHHKPWMFVSPMFFNQIQDLARGKRKQVDLMFLEQEHLRMINELGELYTLSVYFFFLNEFFKNEPNMFQLHLYAVGVVRISKNVKVLYTKKNA